MNEMVETLCKEFEEYAQAKDKVSGEPTIIRLGFTGSVSLRDLTVSG